MGPAKSPLFMQYRQHKEWNEVGNLRRCHALIPGIVDAFAQL